MKAEEEKIKIRATIGTNDADWAMVQKAIKKAKKGQSECLREAVLKDAREVVGKAGKQ